jgi:hypothetical protein
MSVSGPRLPTWAMQQVGSYLGYTGRDANVSAEAALDPCRKSRGHNCCAAQPRQRLPTCVATATASVPGLSAVDSLDEQMCRLGFRFPTSA